jgi:hypothetical protein
LIAAAAKLDASKGFIDRIDPMDCPRISGVITKDTLCEDVTAVVELAITTISEPSNIQNVQSEFESSMEQAIISGDLQTELDVLYGGADNNPITILTGLAVDPSTEPAGSPVDASSPTAGSPLSQSRGVDGSAASQSLSSGGITGIALAALFVVVLFIGCYMYYKRRRTSEPKQDYEEFEEGSHEAEDLHTVNTSMQTDAAVDSHSDAIVGATNLGAAAADYGDESRSKLAFAMEDEAFSDNGDDEIVNSTTATSLMAPAVASSLVTGSMGEATYSAAAASALSRGAVDKGGMRYENVIRGSIAYAFRVHSLILLVFLISTATRTMQHHLRPHRFLPISSMFSSNRGIGLLLAPPRLY